MPNGYNNYHNNGHLCSSEFLTCYNFAQEFFSIRASSLVLGGLLLVPGSLHYAVNDDSKPEWMCPENWHCKRARIKCRNNSRDGSNDAKWKYLKNLFFLLGFLVRLLLCFLMKLQSAGSERFGNGYDFWSGINAEKWIGRWLGFNIMEGGIETSWGRFGSSVTYINIFYFLWSGLFHKSGLDLFTTNPPRLSDGVIYERTLLVKYWWVTTHKCDLDAP